MSKNSSAARARAVATVGLCGAVLLLNGICTQFVAARVNYHSALGDPLFGTVYQPFSWWTWVFDYYEGAPTTYNYAFIIFAVGFGLSLLTHVLYVGFSTRSARKHEGVHGTAQFATKEDLKQTGLLESGKGVYCGGYRDPETDRLYYLRHDGPEHVFALAPTRSGKGVGLVVPTLLSWPHSVLILDSKGENYAMTAGWRRSGAKNVVLRFDPAEPDAGCSWNPLSEIRFGTRYQVSDAQNIALMMLDQNGDGAKEILKDHFQSAAYELITALFLYALYKAEQVGRLPGPYDCAHMLTGIGDFAAPDTVNNLVDDPEGDPRALSGLFNEMRNAKFGDDAAAREAKLVVAGAGNRMANTPARELGSIISTANNAFALYRDPIVGENTSRVDFKVSDLMDHDRPVSLYYVSTGRNTDRLRPLTRLLLSQIIQTLADRMEYDETGRSKTMHKYRLLLLLDEFPLLYKMDFLEAALAYIAGYGIKAYLIAQDVQQIYKYYGSFESIVSNCHIRAAYAPNKYETAEWMSKMTGITTVIKEQITTSGKRFGVLLEQVSRTYQEVQRALMTPDEIMRLPGPVKNKDGDIIEAGEMLIFVSGQPVTRGEQILYFLDPVFSARSKIRPPKESDRVRQNPLVKTEPQTAKPSFVIQ